MYSVGDIVDEDEGLRIIRDSIYEYVINHKKEYHFNSMLDGMIDAMRSGINVDADGLEIEEIDNIEDIDIETDKYTCKIGKFGSFVQRMAHEETKKPTMARNLFQHNQVYDASEQVKMHSYLLGWLIVLPNGEKDSKYKEKTRKFINYMREVFETKEDERRCLCGCSTFCTVVAAIPILKVLLPGWNAPFKYYPFKVKEPLLIPFPKDKYIIPNEQSANEHSPNERTINTIYDYLLSVDMANFIRNNNWNDILSTDDNFEMIKLLISKGIINVDAQDKNGDTLLMNCTRCCDYNLTEFITKNKPNLLIRNNDGENIWDFIVKNKAFAIGQIIINIFVDDSEIDPAILN